MVRSLALIAIVLVASGCASRASSQRLTADVAALRRDVNDLRQAQDATTRDVAHAAAEARALDARVAELVATEATAAKEVSALRDRVETAETALREARAQTVATAPPPAVAPAVPAPAPTMLPERPREPAARTSPLRAAPRDSAARGSAEWTYQAALAMFRSHEYGQAVLDFTDFMAKYPKHPLAANARYWIGEAYYVQRDYRQAMTEFQKVLDVVPESRKVPDALLMIGLCYRNLRDESRARQTWDRVVKDYPKSEAAPKADALMRGKAAAAR